MPPAVHRCNAAEHAIHTFQNHIIARLCIVDKDFLCTSGINFWTRQRSHLIYFLVVGRISAQNYLHATRSMGFTITSIAPWHPLFEGFLCIYARPPKRSTTWSPHTLGGWYVARPCHRLFLLLLSHMDVGNPVYLHLQYNLLVSVQSGFTT